MHSPKAIREFNELRALRTLFRRKRMSRADIARALDLTRSTAGNIVHGLIEAGLLRESEPVDDAEARLGRPSIGIELNPDGAFFVGAEIGVERVTVLVMDLSGEIRHRESAAFQGAGSAPEEATDLAATLVRRAWASVPDERRSTEVSVAIPGFPGVNSDAYHAAILGWHGVPVAALLRNRLGREAQIVLENDANAFAVAETYLKDDNSAADIVVVLIENGVGCGIVAGGRLLRGQLGGAGEIGHVRLGGEGFVFDARRPGRLESYVGKEALAARFGFYGGVWDGLEPFIDALKREDETARRTVADWARYTARGLSILCCLLQPEKIVVGGSVSAVFPHVTAVVEAELQASLIDGFPMPRVTLAPETLGRPALGAACLLHQQMLSGEERFDG